MYHSSYISHTSLFEAVSEGRGEGPPRKSAEGTATTAKPPTSNKGGNALGLAQNPDAHFDAFLPSDYEVFIETNPPSVEYSIDWLTLSFPIVSSDTKAWLQKMEKHDRPRFMDWLRHHGALSEFNDWADLLPEDVDIISIKAPNLKGMNNTRFLYPAGRLAYNSAYPEFGIVCNFSGSDLAKLRESGVDVVKMIRYMIAVGWSVRRLDLAVDVYNGGASVSDFYEYVASENAITSARTIETRNSRRMVEGEYRTAETVYLGSRSSEKFMRVYDKYEETLNRRIKLTRRAAYALAKDTGEIIDLPELPECDSWVRIEIVLRGDYAENAALTLSIHNLQQVVVSHIRNYCDIPELNWYRYALDVVNHVVIEPVRRAITNTERWLDEQVFPAIQKLAQLGSQTALRLCSETIRTFFDSPVSSLYVQYESG